MAWSFVKVGGVAAIDPGKLADASELTNAQLDFVARASSITCPVGIYPGSAYLIVPRTAIDGDTALDRNARHDIAWMWQLSNDLSQQNATTTTYKGYVIHEAECIALDGDSKGAYLLELRDFRQLLFASTVSKIYNVSYTTADGVKHYFGHTLYSGNPWTWQDILNDLWQLLPSGAGGPPTLPFAPAFIPDTIRFVGVSAWEAIGQVLDFCQATVVYDPFADTLSLQRLGAEQEGLADALAGINQRLILDYKPKDNCEKGNVPATLSFVFPRRTYGIGKPADAAYVKEIATGIAGAHEATKLAITMPLIAEYTSLDIDNDDPSNKGACDAAASEMSAKMNERLTRLLTKREKHFASVITSIKPGSEIHAALWRDFGDDSGIRTELASNDHLLLPSGLIVDAYRWPPTELEFIELTTKLALGGIAKARLLEWSQDTKEFEMVGDEFCVQDYTKDSTHLPGKLIAAPTYRGWARRPRGAEGITEANPNPKWPLIELEQVAEIIRGITTTPMDYATKMSAAAIVTAFYNGKNPGTIQNLYDPEEMFRWMLPGAKFMARRNDKEGDGSPPDPSVPDGRYEIVEGETKAGWIYFKLKEDRETGTPAPEAEVEVDLLDYGGTQQDIQEPTEDPLMVTFRAGWYPHALDGAEGFAVLNARDGKYYVVLCDQRALLFESYLDGAMCPGDNATIEDAEPMTYFPFSQDDDTIEGVLNTMDLAGLDSDYFVFGWNESVNDWLAIQVQHHEKDLITDLRFYKPACAVQAKKQKAAIMICEQETDWQDIIALTANEYVRGVRYSCPSPEAEDQNGRLQADIQEQCWFEDNSEAEENWVDHGILWPTPVIVSMEETTDEITFERLTIWTPCYAAASTQTIDVEACPEPTPPE